MPQIIDEFMANIIDTTLRNYEFALTPSAGCRCRRFGRDFTYITSSICTSHLGYDQNQHVNHTIL